jgi:hypothetical protein
MEELLATIVAFLAIVVLSRLRVQLWISMAFGVLLLSGLLGNGVYATARVVRISAQSWYTLQVVCAVTLILLLTHLLKETRALEEAMGALTRLLRSSRAAAAICPGLIALLPMPGGALISAPLVQDVLGGAEKDPGRLATLNFWFRHAWEFSWPLYPSLLIAAANTGWGLPRVCAVVGVMTPAALLLGLLFTRRYGFPPVGPRPSGNRRRDTLLLLRGVFPILFAVVLYFALAPFVGSLSRYWVVVALALGVAVGFIVEARSIPRGFLRGLVARFQYDTVGAVFFVMTFQFVLCPDLPQRASAAGRAAGGAPVDAIARALQSLLSGIPAGEVLLVAAIPLLLGIVLGYSGGMIGISLPLVMTLPVFRAHPYAMLLLAYSFGLIGVFGSPVHPCLVLTARYYRASLGSFYRRLGPLLASTAVVASGLALLYAWLF